MKKSKTRIITTMAVFLALIIVGAFIKIPIPPVPFTLQSFFALMSGAALGGYFGALVVVIYIFMGLIGLPVFASGGGFSYVLTPTFGFLIGMALSALVLGIMLNKRIGKMTIWYIFLAESIATLLVYVIGVAYFFAISKFYLGSNYTLKWILINTFLLFVPKDIVLNFLAAIAINRLNKANILLFGNLNGGKKEQNKNEETIANSALEKNNDMENSESIEEEKIDTKENREEDNEEKE